MQEKYEEILNVIRQFDKVGVCLSGGADSSLVAIAAVDALGKNNVIAITADTEFFTGEEMEISSELCRRLGIRHLTPRTGLLSDQKVMANTEDRCYYCKKNVLSVVKNAAEQANLEVLLDGSLMKEEGMQYEKLCNSPGGKALAELGIVCPLRLCGVTRSQVRDLLKFRGMNDFIQPENACLATRIAVGEPITIKKLRWIRAAENYLSSLGYETVRVRVTAGYRDANGVPFSVTVRISEASSFSSDCYLSVEGNDAIYMVAEDVANAFAYGKSDLLQTESLPQINSETLYSVAVTACGKTNEITDKTGLDALASLYGNLTVKSMAYYVQNAETLAKTGLDAPVQLKFSYKKEVQQQQDDGSVATVTVDASSTVLLGASFADASGNEKTYFTFDSLSYIYEATKETADFLTAYADYVPALTEEESSQAEG